ncbi:aldo/keto reductase, partial [Candidatus Bipolaricaulota bacterium]
MDTVRLGRTELQVTRVGFGGIPIQRVSDEEAQKVILRTLDLGVNFFDTAFGYGTSEERIGAALENDRQRIILATKTPARDCAGALGHLELSLKRLRTDFIDLWQLHNVSTEENYAKVIGSGGALEAAREAQREGVVKHIGLTSHSMDIALKATASGLFETIQFPFNYVTCEAADELIPLAEMHDVGFIGMKPFAGGMLGNARLSIKYVLKWDNVVPDPGIETIEDIDGIVEVLNGDRQLSQEERQEIEKVRSEVGHRFCRRCGYCLPCPAEIYIPTALNLMSFIRRFAAESILGGGAATVAAKAVACLKCGDCETRCPYGLPIREMLVENVKAFEDFKA